jgi:hypothetical protein
LELLGGKKLPGSDLKNGMLNTASRMSLMNENGPLVAGIEMNKT